MRAAGIRGVEVTAQALIPLPVLIPALCRGRDARWPDAVPQLQRPGHSSSHRRPWLRGVRGAVPGRPGRHPWCCTSVGRAFPAWASWASPWWRPDRLSALMLVVSAIVLLAVVAYAIGQGIRDGDQRRPGGSIFTANLSGAVGPAVCTALIFLAGDLFICSSASRFCWPCRLRSAC